jgi:hypothetical protein
MISVANNLDFYGVKLEMTYQKNENDWLYIVWRICHPMFWGHLGILSLEEATTLCDFFILLLCE